MRRYIYINLAASLVVTALLSGCSGSNGTKKANNEQQAEASGTATKPVVVGEETKLLMKYLADNGDYVRSKEYPSIIKASIVNDSLGTNQLIIDLRSPARYSEGHIKGRSTGSLTIFRNILKQE
jgi:hypothetical protein